MQVPCESINGVSKGHTDEKQLAFDWYTLDKLERLSLPSDKLLAIRLTWFVLIGIVEVASPPSLISSPIKLLNCKAFSGKECKELVDSLIGGIWDKNWRLLLKALRLFFIPNFWEEEGGKQ